MTGPSWSSHFIEHRSGCDGRHSKREQCNQEAAMSDYTPTTDEVREMVRRGYLDPRDLDFDDVPGQAFDRWLAQTLAVERERVLREAADRVRAGSDLQNKHTIANMLDARAEAEGAGS